MEILAAALGFGTLVVCATAVYAGVLGMANLMEEIERLGAQQEDILRMLAHDVDKSALNTVLGWLSDPRRGADDHVIERLQERREQIRAQGRPPGSYTTH